MSSILKVNTIQDTDGNNIINESGNVITIGASGDTITVPAGATVSGFTSAGIDDNATSVAITIDSNENVGIGTTSPSSLLHIFSSAPKLIIQDSGTHGTNSAPRLEFKDTSSIQGFVEFADDGTMRIDQLKANPLTILTNNVERMRISSAGLVGIGTSDPKEKLDSRGASVFSGDHATATNAYGTAHGILLSSTPNLGKITAISNGANDVKLELRGLDGGTANSNQLVLDGGTSNVGIGVAPGSTSANGNTIKGLVLGDNANNGVYTGLQILNRVENSTTSNGISIDFDHKTSGATTIPLARIIALPSSSTAGNLRFYTSTSSSLSERMRIDSSGNLLVGTTSVQGGTAKSLQIADSSSARLLLQNTGGGRTYGFFTGTDGKFGLYDYTTSAQRLAIDTSGNIGINTTSPTQKLDVNGTVKATAFQGDGSALTNLPGGGKILQVVTATDSTARSTTSGSFVTASNTLSVNITPSATSSKIFVMASTQIYNASTAYAFLTIKRGSTDLGAASDKGFLNAYFGPNADLGFPATLSILDSPSSTSSLTYQVYFRVSNGTGVLNEQGGKNSITVFEVGA